MVRLLRLDNLTSIYLACRYAHVDSLVNQCKQKAKLTQFYIKKKNYTLDEPRAKKRNNYASYYYKFNNTSR